MERGEIQAITRLIEERRRAAAPAPPSRSLGITLIAGVQFLKAATLLLLAILLRESPERVTSPGSTLYPLVYVATRGKYDMMNTALQGGRALAEVLFLLGLYLAAVGIGMLAASPWARRTLIFSCGMTLALWAKTTLWPAASAAAPPDMTNVYLVLVMDAAVLMYLLRSSTAECFTAKAR